MNTKMGGVLRPGITGVAVLVACCFSSCHKPKPAVPLFYVAVLDYDRRPPSEKAILEGRVEPARVSPAEDFEFTDHGVLLPRRTNWGQRVSCRGIVAICRAGSTTVVQDVENSASRRYEILVEASREATLDLQINEYSARGAVARHFAVSDQPLLEATPVGIDTDDPSRSLFVIVRKAKWDSVGSE